MADAVIVSAVRTPTGRFLGSLKEFTATDLGAMVVAEAVRRAGVDPSIVEECIMGNVVSAGLGQAPARQAALRGGLSNDVAALTINKVCGSGLKAVMLGAQAISAGDTEVMVAGGMESMSNCPYLLDRAREGLRMGHGQVIDSMISDGLWCSFEQCHMGNAGEVVASEYHIDRACQDRYAVESHRRAAAAAAEGRFRAEILPVEVPQRKGAAIVIDRDESVRPETSMEKIGWRLEDVDLVELNEAFAVQAVAVLRDLGLDAGKVNVNGGAVALGHPIGASGARVLTTLLYALEARQLRRGIATLCLGGGNGVALAVERS